MKIGLLGGTFDPIHKGHLKMASAAMKQFGLQKVLLLVAGDPPHKRHLGASAEHRLQMALLATSTLPGVQVSDMEIRRKGTTYTYHTLLECKTLWPKDELFYIVGIDTLQLVKTWYNAKDDIAMTSFIAVRRGGISREEEQQILTEFRSEQKGTVFLCDTVEEEVSSTEIRNDLQNGQMPDALPESVYRYIQENSLYRGME